MWLDVDARTIGRWEAGTDPRKETRRAVDLLVGHEMIDQSLDQGVVDGGLD